MVLMGEKPWVKYVPEEEKTYGRFIVEPLERGYGSTLGNSLRRVLLASLPGAAVTSIKIEGVPHEFANIPGVVEDVLEIILNIKEIVVKSHSDLPKTITLKSKTKGVVRAADIEHDAEVEIINPDHPIATLDAGGKLEIEMTVERGKGYIPGERNKKPNMPIGTLPVDSIFTPIRKVNFLIEEVRVGREINYDRLILEVWTNGSIKPDEALIESAKILGSHVSLFVNIGQPSEELGISVDKGAGGEETSLDMSVEDLELSARSSNCLRKAGIKTVRELLAYSELDLMKVKNFGAKSAKEVKDKLIELSLNLRQA